jgi:GMP synthase-like glutamine amidotransferase
MKILIVDNRSKDLAELQKLLSDHDITVCQRESLITALPETFDVVVLSGGFGTHSVKYHRDYFQAEIDFVKNSKTKVIGICLGCQIVATAFGCTLKELDEKAQGMSTVHMLDGRDLPVYESHRFVIDYVPSEIEVLGTSEHGIEIMQHKTRPIFGLQFHPEMFVNKTEGKEIFFSFLNK